MSNTTKVAANILTPRQSAFIQAYTDPVSVSFSNCYQSAISAGYSNVTARNLLHLKPAWLSDFIGQMNTVQPKQLTEVLTSVIYSGTEPTILKLRAVELMMKYYGMLQQTQPTTAVAVSIDLTGGH